MKYLILKLNRFGYRVFISDPPIITLAGLYPLLLLLVLSMAALAFHLIRIQFSAPIDFSLDWNLFLSWVPLVTAFIADLLSSRFGKLPVTITILSIVWLLFFPNAPYMITDLVHLSVDWGSDLTWHDVIMLFYYAQVSMINGLVSLYWIHRTWHRTYPRFVAIAMFATSIPMVGFGIFLGRMGRWNSWDILHNPSKLFEAVLMGLTDRTAILLSLEFGLLISVSYLVLWSLLRFRIRSNQ
ncbi:DUF1361 domain-containing protein [Telluribacter sp. SYSU D00476]|uniref:DUF1361 domain-containing protein n=1 Tax=Telluribacter sp. SYSU D00476 TaxID=2811430 RepID=UPI001FF5FE3D|nr:DUF1361 domain-containing protein [Telluribacter sp. SYSU D00476]